MRMVDVIDHKRAGNALTTEEINNFIDAYTAGEIPDYQVSALLMAIYFKGMTSQEQTELTLAMLNSGDRLDLTTIPGIKVDKHSTGGVGDKTSLPLAPMIAALGIPIPMISGRGLGHTGGTLDKLEAIPGFKIDLTEAEFIEQIKDINIAIVGATGNIAPADKKLYALRDVTDTVDSIPLIAGSIMSKKIASGTDALVLDVKTGAGAFMKEEAQAVELAQALVEIGKGVGMHCMAVISDMNQPLGKMVGNALEIYETIQILKGQGPADITELIYTLGSYMVLLADEAQNLPEARNKLKAVIENGQALAVFKTMVAKQGGDVSYIDDPQKLISTKYQFELDVQRSGYITKIEANKVGIAAMLLGGGRQTKTDSIDYSVGIELHKKVGDYVEKGQSLLTIYAANPDIEKVKNMLSENIEIKDQPMESKPLIHQVIG